MNNNTCVRANADQQQITRCSSRLKELNHSFERLSGMIELAGNQTRMKILFLLFEEDRLCVCDLSDALGISVSAASQHLRKLKDRRLIFSRKEAQTIYYELTPGFENLMKPFFNMLEFEETLEHI
jgi:ArsR family transcriptional regulator, lead/cadmium/zinc/bismuth-responsive transcriptional repressor